MQQDIAIESVGHMTCHYLDIGFVFIPTLSHVIYHLMQLHVTQHFFSQNSNGSDAVPGIEAILFWVSTYCLL